MTDATRSTRDPIVIVAAARTPMAGFQGDFATLTAPQLGSAAIAARGPRSSAGAASGPRGRPAAVDGMYDGQQDVRLGHARRDVRA
jgi:acetyl-CoA acetyltransferase